MQGLMEADIVEASDEAEVNLLVVRIDDNHYGIPTEQVQEVITSKKATMMPLAPDHVSGLISLRSQVIVLFNLRKILQIPEKDNTNRMTIVVNINGVLCAVGVCEVIEIIRVGRNAIEDAPESISSGVREYITGICNIGSKLMVILDLKDILNV